jgi:hypothetical protein
MSDELLTPLEVDALFRYPRGRSANLARAGMLPVIMLPDGELRFNRRDIFDMIDRMVRPPGDALDARIGDSHT